MNPQIHSILWIQVIGMPIAFLVRTVVLVVRAVREPESRKKHTIRAVSNVLFAASCWTFSHLWLLAAICFTTGIGLSIWAFLVAREQALKNAPVKVVAPAASRRPLKAKAAR
jgi:hypothetical protein